MSNRRSYGQIMRWYAAHHVDGLLDALEIKQKVQSDMDLKKLWAMEMPSLRMAKVAICLDRAGITPREKTAILVYYTHKHRGKNKATGRVLGVRRSRCKEIMSDLQDRISPQLQQEGLIY